MKFERLTRLDELFGESICRAARLLGGTARARAGSGRLRVIVAKLRSIGDVVLALPMLGALKELGAEVLFLSGDINRQWLALQPCIDRVIAVDLKTLWRSPRFFRLLREIRRERADVYVDLTQSSHFASLICRVSNAPVRIGFEVLRRDRRYKNMMYTHRVPFHNGQHIIKNYFALLGPLGVTTPPTLSLPALVYSAADEEAVRAFIAEVNGDGREMFGVHLSGMIPAKCWPLPRWAETLESLLSDKRRVVAIGSREEHARIEEVRGMLGRNAGAMVNAAGRFSLSQIFALMKRFRFFLANDGGPMHIAAAMGIPTLGLFGPETPVRYAPYNKRSISLYKGDGMACSPCSRPYLGSWPTCRRPLCLERIASSEVLRALDVLVPAGGPRAAEVMR
jgi:ADP-heptose:LPS heptosyltransferase